MATDVPLHIQALDNLTEQTLILAHVVELRNSDAVAAPGEIKEMFYRLRIPAPTNVSQYLKILRKQKLAVMIARGRWAVTPQGREHIRILMEEVEADDWKAVGFSADSASLGGAPHALIPPELAPASFQPGIGRFLAEHAFDTNVFGMSRFPRQGKDPIEAALLTCRNECAAHALEFHLASDKAVADLLFENIAAAMWASRYGIAILEDREGEGLNYNAVLEVGSMLVTGRRCLLLKDESIPKLPTDLVGHIYYSVQLNDLDSIREAVEHWITKDLGLP